MWWIVKTLVANWALRRLVLKGLGSLAVLLPIAAILKVVGWPVLLVLAVLALPLLLFLFVIGLPVIFVLLLGGLLLSAVFAVLTAGFAVLKVALIVAVPIAILVLLWRLFFGGGDKPAGELPPPPPPSPSPPGEGTVGG